MIGKVRACRRLQTIPLVYRSRWTRFDVCAKENVVMHRGSVAGWSGLTLIIWDDNDLPLWKPQDRMVRRLGMTGSINNII